MCMLSSMFIDLVYTQNISRLQMKVSSSIEIYMSLSGPESQTPRPHQEQSARPVTNSAVSLKPNQAPMPSTDEQLAARRQSIDCRNVK